MIETKRRRIEPNPDHPTPPVVRQAIIRLVEKREGSKDLFYAPDERGIPNIFQWDPESGATTKSSNISYSDRNEHYREEERDFFKNELRRHGLPVNNSHSLEQLKNILVDKGIQSEDVFLENTTRRCCEELANTLPDELIVQHVTNGTIVQLVAAVIMLGLLTYFASIDFLQKVNPDKLCQFVYVSLPPVLFGAMGSGLIHYWFEPEFTKIGDSKKHKGGYIEFKTKIPI